MINRIAKETIENLLGGFPIVTLTGPRQSGKMTLARMVFQNHPYASLEEPDLRQAANEDPRSFLARFPDGAVLDEVQRCPQILSYLQTLVDKDRRMGLFILTGSQQFGLMQDEPPLWSCSRFPCRNCPLRTNYPQTLMP
jgi:uncharacterized protein